MASCRSFLRSGVVGRGVFGRSIVAAEAIAAWAWLATLLLLLSAGQARSTEWADAPELGEHFHAVGVTGTFVMYDAAADRFHGWNRARAERRYVPASTFKIAHSLIGLESGTIGSVEEVLPYGGKPQPVAAWERDMGLREAIKISNVPVYQALARRIGLERMQALLTRLNYGNQASGSEVDRFWLQGPLTISAAEQAVFLARLASNQLPVADAAQRDVRDITLLEAADGIELHGKTGWYQADGNEPDVGWWVGWARKDDRVYSFALNMDMPDAQTLAAKRIPLGKACLRSLDVLRSDARVSPGH